MAKPLIELGFVTELIGSESKFLFTDKRLSGFVDTFPIKIDGNEKSISIIIGIDTPIKHLSEELNDIFKKEQLLLDQIFVVRKIKLKEIKNGLSLLTIIQDLTAFLKKSEISPMKE